MAVQLITGSDSAGKANVDANFNLQTVTPGFNSVGAEVGGGYLNGQANMSEVDAGTLTGVRDMLSPETDDDYRLRTANDNPLDSEFFNYTTQNTSKHTYTLTTLTMLMTTNGLVTNGLAVNTTNIGMNFGSFCQFPFYGNQTLICEMSCAFSAQYNANTVIDFGLFQRGVTTVFDPTDGVYFRMTSAGMLGVVNYANVETTVALKQDAGTANFTYTNNAVNRYLIQITNARVTFWVNNFKVGEIATPVGQNSPFKSQSVPWSIRHGHVGGAAATITQMTLSDYKVTLRGPQYADTMQSAGSRVFGAYQGLSGSGTVGQLIGGTVTSGTLVKPTSTGFVPLNASLVAGLGSSLGGRIQEALTTGLAVNVDAIFASYQVPAGTTTVPGRRLRVNGVKLSGFVFTVVAGNTVINTEWYIAFGHTAASLATAETGSLVTATTKAPRRVMLPELTQTLTVAQAANTAIAQPSYSATFQNPIYVNAGEFIALVGNKTGTTVATSGVLAHLYQFDYSWE